LTVNFLVAESYRKRVVGSVEPVPLPEYVIVSVNDKMQLDGVYE